MSSTNDRPIVGVLAQEVAHTLEVIYGKGTYDSFIAASYVKNLESSGARVIPISIGQNREYYEDLLGKINGVFFPGGATWFDQANGYADAGEQIFKLAIDLNEKGDYFPLWGTCLGFELLPYLGLQRKDNGYRIGCNSFNESSELIFKKGYKKSRLFGNAQDDVLKVLSEQKITFNYHQFCITEETFNKHKLHQDWTILSTSYDSNGLEYISILESKRFPFYGVQFHPEKIIFEWSINSAIPHTEDAIKANRYFADFFVSECRKNKHYYADSDEESNLLIYNHPVTYSGAKGSKYEQCYFFKNP